MLNLIVTVDTVQGEEPENVVDFCHLLRQINRESNSEKTAQHNKIMIYYGVYRLGLGADC